MCDEIYFVDRRADARAHECERNGLRSRNKRWNTRDRLRAIERRTERQSKYECGEEYEHTHWRRDITDWVFRTEELKKLREIQREMEECEC
jgi:hypothetical protein